MFLTIIFFKNGTVSEHKFNSYPTAIDFECAGYNLDNIASYEVHF
mgnify:CR=1